MKTFRNCDVFAWPCVCERVPVYLNVTVVNQFGCEGKNVTT